MIELKNDTLEFSFPEVHSDAVLRIDFQRTLRIPDDDRDYPLPPGLGRFPLRHVDDFAARVPAAWKSHGGVMLPMYQSEAMWLDFTSPRDYPFAVKVATGKVNAVTGEEWRDGLHRDPQYWKDPAAFMPERFLQSRNAKDKPKAYYPFGAGPRLCIGNNFAIAEMTLFLQAIIHRFEILPTNAIPQIKPLITLRPDKVVLEIRERVMR